MKVELFSVLPRCQLFRDGLTYDRDVSGGREKKEAGGEKALIATINDSHVLETFLFDTIINEQCDCKAAKEVVGGCSCVKDGFVCGWIAIPNLKFQELKESILHDPWLWVHEIIPACELAVQHEEDGRFVWAYVSSH